MKIWKDGNKTIHNCIGEFRPNYRQRNKKTCPCVVLSPDEMNKYLNTIVVAPMTTNLKDYPTRILLHHNGKVGMISMDQIWTIDNTRKIKNYGHLTKS